jgi:hypothetical protein
MSVTHPPRRIVTAQPGTEEFLMQYADYRRLKRKEARHGFIVMTMLTMTCYLVVAASVWMLMILVARGRG